MPRNEVYMQKISESLSMMVTKVRQDGGANLTSTNVLAESFYREFLNILCGWTLDSANIIGNMPGFDLISEKDRVVVQISSVASRKKLQETLDKLDLDVCGGYRLIFLLIADKRPSHSGIAVPEGIRFDPEKDVWSNTQLLRMALDLDIERLKQLDALCGEYFHKTALNPAWASSDASSSGAMRFAGQSVAFHPIISAFQKGKKEYVIGDITVVLSERQYQLPGDIRALFERTFEEKEREKIDSNTYEPKVRIEKLDVNIYGRGRHLDEIILTFSKTYYRDFLIEMKLLDQRLPGGKKVREQYMSRDQLKPEKSELPCQCGAGLFLITRDNYLLYSQASPNVAVNPNQLNYVSSGSLDWEDDQTNPFYDIIRECGEELDYRLSREHLYLYSFGLDLGRGFYQFSFFERSLLNCQEIIERAESAPDYATEFSGIRKVPFELKPVCELLRAPNWDETAKANLILLASKEFGRDAVEKELNPVWYRNKCRRVIQDECDRRAGLPGALAVLSVLYPRHRMQEMLDSYVEHALDFITEELEYKRVFEVGCGIGAMTRPLAERARELAAVDVSQKMLDRTREALSPELAGRVKLTKGFVQDMAVDRRYDLGADRPYDLVVCSNVLIHNHDELDEIAGKLAELSDVIYLFERVNEGTQPIWLSGGFTQPLREEEYIALFPDYEVRDKEEYVLFRKSDGTPKHTILFLKLVRK